MDRFGVFSRRVKLGHTGFVRNKKGKGLSLLPFFVYEAHLPGMRPLEIDGAKTKGESEGSPHFVVRNLSDLGAGGANHKDQRLGGFELGGFLEFLGHVV